MLFSSLILDFSFNTEKGSGSKITLPEERRIMQNYLTWITSKHDISLTLILLIATWGLLEKVFTQMQRSKTTYLVESWAQILYYLCESIFAGVLMVKRTYIRIRTQCAY